MKKRAIWCWLLGSVSIVGAMGCRGSEGVPQSGVDPGKLVPVNGVVTLHGKPMMAKAVVTFLPESGSPCVGETDENGRFTLRSQYFPGALPGDYKVAISYLVSAEGDPQGRSARDPYAGSPGLKSATERLPAEYSDLGRTRLRAKVEPQGGSINFDLNATIAKNEHEPESTGMPVAPSNETAVPDRQ
ncbi:hypothetical protein V5E97_02590 [Singulisphaera sp. Ch08]|uniref:Carboxypeptidase regulatory-like domain-containing protein n=1 Tax=Singulisphaera sp. Ch08 TaxID=3120278 RepID=A0AAU7CIP6_9BACT